MAYQQEFEAMSDHTRRRIVDLLAAGPRSVVDIAGQLPVSRPAVSQHLKVLLDAGLNRTGFLSMTDYIDQLWDTALHQYREAARGQKHHEGDGNGQ
jgi:predicted transcriptional regulator